MKHYKYYTASFWYTIGMMSVLFSGSFSLSQAQSTIFQVHDRPVPEGQEEVGVLATPQEKRGPQLDLDLNSTPIVTFKAAKDSCEAMALMPSVEATQKGVKLQIVYNNRLPMSHKWKKDTKIVRELPFVGPVRVYYDSAGTTSGHGGALYIDTNHNWGYRLLVNGQPVKKEGDYIKYIRHGYSTTVPFDISKLTISEAEMLVQKDNLTKAFEQEILQPLNQKIANNESWSGTHKGFHLVMIPTPNGQEHGIEGSLDEYLTDRSVCTNESFTQSDDWTFIQLKK